MANLPRRMPIWQHIDLPSSYASRVLLPLRLSAVLCVAAAAILLLSAADFHRVPDGRSFCWFMNVMPVFCFPSLRQRPLIMRSDSELLIFCFRSEKRMGVFYAVRLCKIRLWSRDKIRFENPMAQVVRFWPKIRRLDPSYHQIEKWHRSFVKQKSGEQSRPRTAAVVHTNVRVRVQRSKRWTITQQRRANAVAASHRSQTTASCRSTRART